MICTDFDLLLFKEQLIYLLFFSLNSQSDMISVASVVRQCHCEYFEKKKHESYFVQNRRIHVDPIKLISRRQISTSIALNI